MLAWMPPSPFNPFPKMLYANLKASGVVAVETPPREMDVALDAARAAGTRIVFHQHWTGWVLGGETDRAKAVQRLDQAFQLLDSIDEAPLVWTVHNAMPHACHHPDLERRLRQRLASQAQVIHVMNPLTPQVVDGQYTLEAGKIQELAHPDYRAVYGRLPDRARARRRLGIDQDATWLAFLGQVRDYKNLPLLLDALDLTPGVNMIVAGATGATSIADAASRRAARSDRVHRIDGHLNDEELMEALAASNGVVIPYQGLLNSGVIALARSFGRAVIAPDTSHVKAITDEGSSFYFSPDNAASLATAMGLGHGDPPPTNQGADTPRRFARLIADMSA